MTPWGAVPGPGFERCCPSRWDWSRSAGRHCSAVRAEGWAEPAAVAAGWAAALAQSQVAGSVHPSVPANADRSSCPDLHQCCISEGRRASLSGIGVDLLAMRGCGHRTAGCWHVDRHGALPTFGRAGRNKQKLIKRNNLRCRAAFDQAARPPRSLACWRVLWPALAKGISCIPPDRTAFLRIIKPACEPGKQT